MKIVLLDDKVKKKYLRFPEAVESFSVRDGTLQQNGMENDSEGMTHGTICATILEEIIGEMGFTCIEIFTEEMCAGDISDLKVALEYCMEIEANIISLSAGSVKISDYAILHPIIKELAQRHTHIIAAQSNYGYLTIPSAFQEVYGVVATGDMVEEASILRANTNILGIDLIVVLPLCGERQRYRGNSFGVPIVVGWLNNLLEEKKTLTKGEVMVLVPYINEENQKTIFEKFYREVELGETPPYVFITRKAISNVMGMKAMMDYLNQVYHIESICFTEREIVRDETNGELNFQVYEEKLHKTIFFAKKVDIIFVWMEFSQIKENVFDIVVTECEKVEILADSLVDTFSEEGGT